MSCLYRTMWKLSVNRILLLAVFLFPAPSPLPAKDSHHLIAPPFRISSIFDEGEAAHAEGLWGEGLEFYKALDVENLEPEAREWYAFRLADLTWRHHHAAQHRDQSEAQHAFQTLLRMQQALEGSGSKLRLHAEILESLGDCVLQNYHFRWRTKNMRELYTQALDLWEVSMETDVARHRYFQLLRKKFALYRSSETPLQRQEGPFPVSRERIEKAIRIAEDADTRAWLDYLKALSFLFDQGVEEADAMLAHLERMGELSRGREWEDDYLHHLAVFWEEKGLHVEETWFRPDYRQAVSAAETLRDHFQEGESRWWNAAGSRIVRITEPAIEINSSEVFSEATYPVFHLRVRNVEEISIRIFPARLDEMLAQGGQRAWGGLLELPLDDLAPVWEKNLILKPFQPHEPYSQQVDLRRRLPLGAYLIQAKSEGVEARAFLLVSNTTMLRTNLQDGRTMVWVVDSLTGEPRPDQQVQFFAWGSPNAAGERIRTLPPERTNELGQAFFERNYADYYTSISMCARHQAFLQEDYSSHTRPDPGSYRLAVQTDRPVYRHGDTLKWRITARRNQNSRLETPGGERFRLTFYVPKPDRMREVVWEGVVRLNEFGSVAGEIPLAEEISLGELRLYFQDLEVSARTLDTPAIARLEAFRLAEFVVEVDIPKRDGASAVFPPDTAVSVPIRARDAHGLPIAGAEVEALVYRHSLRQDWSTPTLLPTCARRTAPINICGCIPWKRRSGIMTGCKFSAMTPIRF